MEKSKKAVRAPVLGQFVRGRSVATLGQGMALVKIGKSVKKAVRPEECAGVLVKKALRALSKPGIERSAIFCGPNPAKVFACSIYPLDTTKFIREAADGTRVLGRVVNGKFRAIKA
jgi:hypothetical protein